MIHSVRTIGGDVHLENRPITLAANRLDRDPRQRQIICELMVVDVKVNEIAQPLRRNLHDWLLAPSLQLPAFTTETQKHRKKKPSLCLCDSVVTGLTQTALRT